MGSDFSFHCGEFEERNQGGKSTASDPRRGFQRHQRPGSTVVSPFPLHSALVPNDPLNLRFPCCFFLPRFRFVSSSITASTVPPLRRSFLRLERLETDGPLWYWRSICSSQPRKCVLGVCTNGPVETARPRKRPTLARG